MRGRIRAIIKLMGKVACLRGSINRHARPRCSRAARTAGSAVVDQDRRITGHHIVRMNVGHREVTHDGVTAEVLDGYNGDVVSRATASYAGTRGIALDTLVVVHQELVSGLEVCRVDPLGFGG